VAHKTITISEEAYNMLASLRGEGESFTEVIKRTVKGLKGKPLSDFAGRWAGSPDELDGILARVAGMWIAYDETLGMRA